MKFLFKPLFCGCFFLLVGTLLGGNVAAKTLPPKAFGVSVFENLDYGLYWFGPDMAHEKAGGPDNAYFNPHAPTVIYVHGWEVGHTQRQYREVFDYAFMGGPKQYLAEPWINDGWNVGVFYWNQFSDELLPGHAEAKIWTHRSVAKMRWKNHEGRTKTPARFTFVGLTPWS